jgi:hypothetical protein
MRCDRCHADEEWLSLLPVSFDTIFEEAIRQLSDEVRAVLVLVERPVVIVMQKTSIEEVIAEWVDKDLGSGPTRRIGVIEVVDGDLIQEFASVVRVVASVLEKDGKRAIVVSLLIPLCPTT